MQTQQQTTWMHYLIIGLLISLLGLNNSCKKTRDYAQFGDFYYVNETNYTITFYNNLAPDRYKQFNILPHSTTLIQETQDAIKEVTPARYHSPLTGYVPPLIVKFNSSKCWEILPNSEHTPLAINNYVAEKLGERKYKFTYTFTEEDYNRAVTCP